MPRTRVNLPLYSGGYKGDAERLSSFSCLNLYPEPLSGEPGSQVALIGTPGTRLITSVGAGAHRGAIKHLKDAYFVSGNGVYKYTPLGVLTLIGTLNTSTGIVSMSSNGETGGQLTIVDGVNVYVWDGATLTVLADPDILPNPIKTLFIEGYTILLGLDTSDFQISDFYDSSSYSGLNFGRAELDQGNLLAVAKYNRQVWLTGENVTEVWYNSGNDFPFDHVPNGLIEWGILAPNSIASTGNVGLLWLAKNKYGQGEVIKTEGFSASSVTPPTILSQWRTYSRLDDAIAFIYQEHGHLFYQITFPTANKTWVYDATLNSWHERSTNGGRHLANSYVYFNGMHIVGDFNSGNIYELDMDVFTDNGESISRQFTTSHITDSRQQIRHNFLELEGESGVGLLEGQGSDPVINMEFSDDGGHTYKYARGVKYGKQGGYNKVARWPMLGITRSRVYRFSMSDPIKYRFNRLVLDFIEMRH